MRGRLKIDDERAKRFIYSKRISEFSAQPPEEEEEEMKNQRV